ncbi:MAG: hypothetical protein L0F95_08000 [Lactococcus sp.]|nr:hypothetical protein [Lactococcus sp.]MDN5412330.1 hypothetical protein [Lactococcus sp.]MDN5436967.1 hypothetical protein [Lactococcus sp.]MDN5462265.1 hypothetical protein [Lactococcus sp.]
MSKQWGHGFHQGKAQGQKQGILATALVSVAIYGVQKIAKKTGLTEKIKQKLK